MIISLAVEIIKRETFPRESETIDLNKIIGRVLAEEDCADVDLPPFNRSQTNGFALKADDTKKTQAENYRLRLFRL